MKILINVFNICAILPLVCTCMDQKTNLEMTNRDGQSPKFVSILKNYIDNDKNVTNLSPISLKTKQHFENSVVEKKNETFCSCLQLPPEIKELCAFLTEINRSIVTYNESLLLAVRCGFFNKVGKVPILNKSIYAAPLEILLKMFPSFTKYIVAFECGNICEIPLATSNDMSISLYQKRVFINPIHVSIVKWLRQKKCIDFDSKEARDIIFRIFEEGLDSSKGTIDIDLVHTAITYKDYVLIKAE